nr:ComEA family DNA-binding protein [Streptomyces griseus]
MSPNPSPNPIPRPISSPSPSGSAGAGPGESPGGDGLFVGSAATPARWWRMAGPALRDRLPLWVQLRCGLEPRSLAALAVVLVGAAVLAVTHFWSARPESVRAPERVAEAAEARPGERASSDRLVPGALPRTAPSSGVSALAGNGGQVVVDVSGKVRRPGVRRLPAGSRVADALRAAGGVREGTDVTGLNRARVLTDGEQVIVGLPAVQAATGAAVGGAGGSGAGQTGPAVPVSLTTATVEQLDALPGVGPVLAQHIIDYRTEHGGYRSVDELGEVKGIGDRRLADLRPLVRP